MQYWLPELVPPRALLDLGFVTVYWYSICFVTGIAAAYAVVRKHYRAQGGDVSFFENAFLLTVSAGIVGARLWHVFVFQWEYYSQHPGEIVRIWEGGIAIQGALIAGLLALVLYSRHRSESFWKLADAFALGLPLGQAIGRWGNFFNQELYGSPTGLPWGVFIQPENRVPGFESVSYFHPAFFYESVLNALLFAALLRLSRKGKREGFLVAGYLAGYGMIRCIIDFVRIDPMPAFAGLRYSQWVSIFLVFAAVILYVRGRPVLPKRD